MTTFTIIRDTELPAKEVWNILSDFTRSPTSAFTVKVEKKGDSRSNGIGTIRILNIGKRRFRERLESVEPPNLFTYQLLSGAPVKEYFGTVDVQSRNSTALINWNVKFTPKIIGTGWIIKRLAKRTINHVIDEIISEYLQEINI
jgi:hypothetical protein